MFTKLQGVLVFIVVSEMKRVGKGVHSDTTKEWH